MKRRTSHLLDHVNITYAVFSMKKFQPESNNEENLDKFRMWDILQSNLRHKILKKKLEEMS